MGAAVSLIIKMVSDFCPNIKLDDNGNEFCSHNFNKNKCFNCRQNYLDYINYYDKKKKLDL